MLRVLVTTALLVIAALLVNAAIMVNAALNSYCCMYWLLLRSLVIVVYLLMLHMLVVDPNFI